jgi:hypothetical protein
MLKQTDVSEVHISSIIRAEISVYFEQTTQRYPRRQPRETDILQYTPCLIECREGVVNTPASYSGGFGFKSRPGDRLL